MLVLAGGLVSKVYSCLNAPLMTEVVCKATHMSEINSMPPVKPVLSELCVAQLLVMCCGILYLVHTE